MPQQTEAALPRGDREGAERAAHTLNGVAASLGGDGVQEAARVLEATIGSGRQRVHGELDAVRAELAPVLVGLSRLDPAAGPAPGTGPLDSERVGPLLRRLRGLLEQDDANAAEPLQALHGLQRHLDTLKEGADE